MIIVMDNSAGKENVTKVIDRLTEFNLDCHTIKGESKTVIGTIGEEDQSSVQALEALPYVERIIPITKPYKLASREFKQADTEIQIGTPSSNQITIGGSNLSIMAGPCAVEGKDEIRDIAAEISKQGGTILRGGAFKPRTSPYSFQGLGEQGLKHLYEAGREFNLKVITEVMDSEHIEVISQYADILQIGARNMQNFELLKAVGKSSLPVMIKRGMSAKIEEWLMAAEYILSQGNYDVILCERGIRTFETATRNTLDLSAVSLVKQLSHLPVIVDPSHGTGDWKLISSMSKAAVAAGADGLMIEVHPTPSQALSDGKQSLTYENFHELVNEITDLAKYFDKTLTATQNSNIEHSLKA